MRAPNTRHPRPLLNAMGSGERTRGPADPPPRELRERLDALPRLTKALLLEQGYLVARSFCACARLILLYLAVCAPILGGHVFGPHRRAPQRGIHRHHLRDESQEHRARRTIHG